MNGEQRRALADELRQRILELEDEIARKQEVLRAILMGEEPPNMEIENV
jgi:hypothetical protein